MLFTFFLRLFCIYFIRLFLILLFSLNFVFIVFRLFLPLLFSRLFLSLLFLLHFPLLKLVTGNKSSSNKSILNFLFSFVLHSFFFLFNDLSIIVGYSMSNPFL